MPTHMPDLFVATSSKSKNKSNIYATKGSQTISEYMQFIKVVPMNLALLTNPWMMKNSLKKILDRLDDEYKSIVDAIEGLETLISFDELHEKLINKLRGFLTSQSVHLFTITCFCKPSKHPA